MDIIITIRVAIEEMITRVIISMLATAAHHIFDIYPSIHQPEDNTTTSTIHHLQSPSEECIVGSDPLSTPLCFITRTLPNTITKQGLVTFIRVRRMSCPMCGISRRSKSSSPRDIRCRLLLGWRCFVKLHYTYQLRVTGFNIVYVVIVNDVGPPVLSGAI